MEISDQIWGIVSLLVGGAVFAFFAWTLFRRKAIRSWSVTEGRVLESRVDESQSDYEPYVRYSYVVAGRTYTSEKFSAVTYIYDARRQVERLIEPFALGKVITVYYGPARPSESVIYVRNPIGIDILFVIISLVFIVIGAMFIIQGN